MDRPLAEIISELRALLRGDMPITVPVTFNWEDGDHFVGLSGVEVAEELEIGEGIFLRPAFADVFSHPMAAFAPPPAARAPHPGPWVAVGNGQRHFVRTELALYGRAHFAPEGHHWFGHERIAWLVPALIRLLADVPARAVFASNAQISKMKDNPAAVASLPMDQATHLMGDWRGPVAHLPITNYSAFQRDFKSATKLLQDDRFYRAFMALDQSRFAGGVSGSSTLLWTALETVFALGFQHGKRNLLRKRLASFLGSDDNARSVIANAVSEAYEDRCHAIHAGHEASQIAYQAVFIIAQWVFQQIVRAEKLP